MFWEIDKFWSLTFGIIKLIMLISMIYGCCYFFSFSIGNLFTYFTLVNAIIRLFEIANDRQHLFLNQSKLERDLGNRQRKNLFEWVCNFI